MSVDRLVEIFSQNAPRNLAGWLRTRTPKDVLGSIFTEGPTPVEYLNLDAQGQSAWIRNGMPLIAPTTLRKARIQMNRPGQKTRVTDPLVWLSDVGLFIKYSLLDPAFPVIDQVYMLDTGEVYGVENIVAGDLYLFEPGNRVLIVLVPIETWEEKHPLRIPSEVADPSNVVWDANGEHAQVGNVKIGVDPYRKTWVGWLQRGNGARWYLAEHGKLTGKPAQAEKFKWKSFAQKKLPGMAMHPDSAFNRM